MTHAHKVIDEELPDFDKKSPEERQRIARKIMAAHVKDMKEEGRNVLPEGVAQVVQNLGKFLSTVKRPVHKSVDKTKKSW